MASDWEPILTGADRELAFERTREIVEALGKARADGTLDHAGPAGGKSGVAVMAAYVDGAGIPCGDLADELLGEAVEAVAETPLEPSLYAGFTGIAWVAEHLAGAPDDEEDANEEIDAALLEHLKQTPWRADYDLVSGLAGFAVYALERIEHGRESGKQLLAEIVRRLDELLVEVEGSPGATWWTPPTLMIPETAAANPQGNYNVGLAHGSPGPIAVLGAALAAGVEVDRARSALQRAVTWLLSTRSAKREGAQFPYTVNIPPDPQDTVRTAWCYGDPGVAVALLWAGQTAGEPSWVEIAHETATICVRRPANKVGVVDAGLCHGSAGLALCYNRLYQATRDASLRDAAVLWAKKTMEELYQPGKGMAGYLSYFPLGEDPWISDPGVLTGAAGIALGLMACATENEPRWDRFLLTSARPKPR